MCKHPSSLLGLASELFCVTMPNRSEEESNEPAMETTVELQNHSLFRTVNALSSSVTERTLPEVKHPRQPERYRTELIIWESIADVGAAICFEMHTILFECGMFAQSVRLRKFRETGEFVSFWFVRRLKTAFTSKTAIPLGCLPNRSP